jgi:hypothetical protein
VLFPVHRNRGRGGSHFTLGIKQHQSTVNRRDNPHAVDDKQHIEISLPSPVLEEHQITLQGADLSGTFTLSVGGKTSRPIDVAASSSAVAAALRQEFSHPHALYSHSFHTSCSYAGMCIENTEGRSAFTV